MKLFNSIFIRLLVLLIAILAARKPIYAKELKKITALQLTYWEAFRGTIEQEIKVDESGDIYLTTKITDDSGLGSAQHKSKTRKLRLEDIDPILAFVNDDDLRKQFAEAAVVIKPDGATTELTVRENSLGVVFFSQYPFKTNAQQRLHEIVRQLLKLGGIESAIHLQEKPQN